MLYSLIHIYVPHPTFVRTCGSPARRETHSAYACIHRSQEECRCQSMSNTRTEIDVAMTASCVFVSTEDVETKRMKGRYACACENLRSHKDRERGVVLSSVSSPHLSYPRPLSMRPGHGLYALIGHQRKPGTAPIPPIILPLPSHRPHAHATSFFTVDGDVTVSRASSP